MPIASVESPPSDPARQTPLPFEGAGYLPELNVGQTECQGGGETAMAPPGASIHKRLGEDLESCGKTTLPGGLTRR